MSAETGIDQGRSAFSGHCWTEAYENFRDADQRGGLPAADLERLAIAEILTGGVATGLESLTRAHEEYLLVGDVNGAARCAAWMAMHRKRPGRTRYLAARMRAAVSTHATAHRAEAARQGRA